MNNVVFLLVSIILALVAVVLIDNFMALGLVSKIKALFNGAPTPSEVNSGNKDEKQKPDANDGPFDWFKPLDKGKITAKRVKTKPPEFPVESAPSGPAPSDKPEKKVMPLLKITVDNDFDGKSETINVDKLPFKMGRQSSEFKNDYYFPDRFNEISRKQNEVSLDPNTGFLLYKDFNNKNLPEMVMEDGSRQELGKPFIFISDKPLVVWLDSFVRLTLEPQPAYFLQLAKKTPAVLTITVKKGDLPPETIDIPANQDFYIGSGREISQCVIQDSHISKRHVRLQYKDGGFYLKNVSEYADSILYVKEHIRVSGEMRVCEGDDFRIGSNKVAVIISKIYSFQGSEGKVTAQR